MIEVAACEGLSRLHGLVRDSPWCHQLSREDFEAIRDDAYFVLVGEGAGEAGE
jgi:hypothetical protein